MGSNAAGWDGYRQDHGPKTSGRVRDLQEVTVQFNQARTRRALRKELDKRIYLTHQKDVGIVLHIVRCRRKITAEFGPPEAVLTKWKKVFGWWTRLSMLSLPMGAVTVFRKFLDYTFDFESIDMCPSCGRIEYEEKPNGKKHCTTCDLDWPRDETESTDAA